MSEKAMDWRKVVQNLRWNAREMRRVSLNDSGMASYIAAAMTLEAIADALEAGEK